MTSGTRSEPMGTGRRTKSWSTIAAFACVAGLSAPNRLPAATAADLHWLAGCWALRGGEPGAGAP